MLRLIRAQKAKVRKVIRSDGAPRQSHSLDFENFLLLILNLRILCLLSEFKGCAGWVVRPRLLPQQAEEGQG